MNKIIELFKAQDKRLIICASITSIILAIFEVVGHSINTYYDLREIIGSYGECLLSIGKIILYATLIYLLIILVTNLIQRIKHKEIKEYALLTANTKSFFWVWGIIFLLWFPYFLQYYPGILSPDSIRQIQQVLGEMNYTTHHPIIHTLIIKIFIDIGNVLNNLILGISLYSIFQMLVMSAIFAFVVYYISKKKMPNIIRLLVLLSFAIYPIHAMYSITMWKDILFGGAIVLYTIWIYEYTQNREFVENKKNIISFIILTVMIIMLRKNGMIVTIFVAPFLIFLRKDKIKKVALMILASYVLYIMIHTSLVNIYNADKGEIREALAIPIQQLARVVTKEENNLRQEEISQIKKFIQSDQIAELYNPVLADPIKDCFNSSVFNQNKIEFIGMWTKLFFKYPLDYIEAFLCNSYGYWYPEAKNWVVATEVVSKATLGVEPIINTKTIPNIVSFSITKRKIPILFSIGSNVWIMLISFMLCFYKKKYNVLLAFIPSMALVLTSMASPVFCEFRYVYGVFTSMPFLLAITYIEIKNNETKKINSEIKK